MYQAWYESDQALENSGATYQRRIDAINEALKKLYLAKNCCLTDSGEYIDERIKLLNSSLNTVSVMDSNTYELNSIFDSSIFAALTMAFQNDDINAEYMVNDVDNDGNLELAVYTSVSKNGGKSCILFENVINPGIYSFFGHGAAGYRVFVYDNESGKILLNNNWASASRPKIAYSEWNGQEWSLISLLSETISYDSFDISDCYWNNKTVSKEQFMELSDSIQNNWENSDYIFNNYTYHNLSDITEAFSNYLSDYYDIKSEISYVNNGIKTNIITVNRIADRWLNNMVLLNDIAEEKFNLLKTAVTTCFIIDEYQGKTRIRCQNFDKDVIFSNDGNGIAAQIDKFPYEVSVSFDDDSLDNDIITLKEVRNGLTKEEVGDISGIELNIKARAFAHDGLFLREGPSTSTKQIELIPFGSELSIISLKNDYRYGTFFDDSMIKIKYNNKEGYVCSKFLLVDNTYDISKLNAKQVFAYSNLLYTQSNVLTTRFWYGGGIFDWSYSDEYDIPYRKMLPAGLTIAKLTEDYYNYFSKDLRSSRQKIDVDFNGIYMEKDGYIWLASAVGGDPDWINDEIVEITNYTPNAIKLKVIRHLDEKMCPENEANIEYVFEMRFEDGRWKVTLLDPIF